MRVKNIAFVACIAGATLAVAAVLAAQANLITNGSFELPVVSAGGFASFAVGSTAIPGFTVVGPAGKEVSIASGSSSQFDVSFPAEDGSQWLDLTGLASNSTEGVAQTIATTIGHVYQLSYFIGDTTGGGVFGSTSTVNVSVNGVPTFSDTNSTVSPTTLTYQQFTHTFIATGISTTLVFLNGDPPSDNSNMLDNIVLADLSPAGASPVPEPTLLALFGTGLYGSGLVRHRKTT